MFRASSRLSFQKEGPTMYSTATHPTSLASYRPFSFAEGSEEHAARDEKIAGPDSAYRLYRRVAGAWAGVFVVAGLAFMLVPGLVGTGLVTLAGVLGLGGEVPTAPGSLWFVLTGSLMATISMLALQTARRPEESAPYVSLMTAKLVSTVAFLFLARHANIWLLCAACDGFIALTLAAARSYGDRALGRVDFVGRYLRSLGVSDRGVREYEARTEHLPGFARVGVWVAVFVIGVAAPLLLLGTWSRAARLGDEEFAELTHRLNHSPLPVVRGLWLMVHRPALSMIAKARAPEYRA
jgi:hypothetical protein